VSITSRLPSSRKSGSALALSLVLALPLLCAAAPPPCSAPEPPGSSINELPPSEAMMRIQEPQPVSVKPEEVERLEKSLLKEPKDEAIRGKLIAHYYLNADADNYKRHVFWLIDNLPESVFTCRKSMGLFPRALLVTPQDSERAKMRWHQQVSAHGDSVPVLINAAILFAPVDPFLSERWLIQARKLETAGDRALRELVHIYHGATYGVAGGAWIGTESAFCTHVRQVLVSTNDAQIAGRVGQAMSFFQALHFPTGSPQAQHDEVLMQNLARIALAESYLKRAVALDFANPRWQLALTHLQQTKTDYLRAEKRLK
jgi:hypothetical protein